MQTCDQGIKNDLRESLVDGVEKLRKRGSVIIGVLTDDTANDAPPPLESKEGNESQGKQPFSN